jgi:hypothetical protein
LTIQLALVIWIVGDHQQSCVLRMPLEMAGLSLSVTGHLRWWPLIFAVFWLTTKLIYPNVAIVGGLQIQGVKGEVVVLYFESLTTQKLKSSGVPRGFKGK